MVSIVVFVFGIIILEVLFILFIAGFHLAKFVFTKEATQVKLEEQKLVQQETELADFSLKDIYLANTRETIRYFNLLIPISIGLGFCTTTIFLFANRKR